MLKRMLTSGNRAAYAALLREAIGVSLKPLDAILGVLENRRRSKTVATEQPLILIVGAPRSGTTLVYQALATYLDVTYPSNLTALFPKAPLTAAQLQELIPTRRSPDFCNFYGQTTRMRSPNDAFHLWNRWFGEDRYQTGQQLSSEKVAEMRRFFGTWTSCFQKPFLNKNNRNTDCIQQLAEYLPKAYFVVVRRNPEFVVQSLIRAREEVQGCKNAGWGLKSESATESADPLAYVEAVCRQVQSIDRDLDRQLNGVDPQRVFEMTYENFCKNPQSLIRSIVDTIPGLQLNTSLPLTELAPFQISQNVVLTPEEQARLQHCLQDHSLPSDAVVDV